MDWIRECLAHANNPLPDLQSTRQTTKMTLSFLPIILIGIAILVLCTMAAYVLDGFLARRERRKAAYDEEVPPPYEEYRDVPPPSYTEETTQIHGRGVPLAINGRLIDAD